MGPGAGRAGGRIVAEGTPAQIIASPDSLTGKYLARARSIGVPRLRNRPGPQRLLVPHRADFRRDIFGPCTRTGLLPSRGGFSFTATHLTFAPVL